MLRKKPYVQDHNLLAEQQLSARLEILRSRGLSEKEIRKDPKFRNYLAAVHKAKRQLANILKLEKQIARKEQIKAEKAAAPRMDPPKRKKVPDPKKNREQRERKRTAAAQPEEDI